MEDKEKKQLEKNQKRRKAPSKKTVSSKVTRIGKARYTNEFGEVETFNVIEEHDQDFNFQKIWLGHLLESLDVLGNAKIKVLNYLLANKNSDNQIIGTQRAIAQGVGVSVPVVNETIKKLKEVNAIKQVSSGVLMLNPEIVFQGKHSKRMNILLKYSKTETLEHNKGEENED
jgi:23S rRNA A1618 N6-methylase RlmF